MRQSGQKSAKCRGSYRLGRITDEMYDNFLREYKEKQAELLSQMQDHSDADEQFYITANMTLNIAKGLKRFL